ncbi:hypothetical protein [Dongshaea marina]|nr:hypothetical protein [Dongshaea marina]
MESAIGGRWSAPYKVPVFLNMFGTMMTQIMKEHPGVAESQEHCL